MKTFEQLSQAELRQIVKEHRVGGATIAEQKKRIQSLERRLREVLRQALELAIAANGSEGVE